MPAGFYAPGSSSTSQSPSGRRETSSRRRRRRSWNTRSEVRFVQTGPKTYRRADVETGLVTDKRVEIVKGVAAGEPVVVEGAMALKSEMLVPTLSKED